MAMFWWKKVFEAVARVEARRGVLRREKDMMYGDVSVSVNERVRDEKGDAKSDERVDGRVERGWDDEE